MACRPQSNPRSTSSDGVPPELEVLGFRGVLCRTGLTGRHNRSNRSVRREPVCKDRVDDPRVLALSSVLAQISVNSFFEAPGLVLYTSSVAPGWTEKILLSRSKI